uniref:Myosin-G heavy chain-like n=1 Tax=Crassostrea virginica TaxID=6565 RepID=A0A8B8B839_CRAVI|nr:myosin-G heavy chain-like [Crassostrea virginica]
MLLCFKKKCIRSKKFEWKSDMISYESLWIVVSIGLCKACTYIDHGAYYKGSSSTLLYSKSGTIESCKAECSANPSCNGFGRMSGTCYFSSTIVPFSTTCSSCSYFTKDNCDTTTKTTTSTTTVKPTTTAMTTTPTTPLAATTSTTTPVAATTPVEATTTPVAATTTPVAVTTPVAATTKTTCTYIDHGAYYKGSYSTLLYSKSGTIESCKAECSANPSCNGFGRQFDNCHFSSTIVPFSTSCSSCSYFTKDNCEDYCSFTRLLMRAWNSKRNIMSVIVRIRSVQLRYNNQNNNIIDNKSKTNNNSNDNNNTNNSNSSKNANNNTSSSNNNTSRSNNTSSSYNTSSSNNNTNSCE